MELMTVREFIKRDVDVDVTDDVCDELCIAFVGPVELTDAGKERFAYVLDYEVELDADDGIATVLIDGDDGDEWMIRLEHAKAFFRAAAGICSERNYHKWFKG